MTEIKFGLRLLETLTSALYDNPIVLFREYIQNSVDAYDRALNDSFEKIKDFSVNITIKSDERIIKILDNGYGILEKDFYSKMIDIGIDTKSDIVSQIGFRGIGRLSAIPFCKKLIFCNKEKNNKNILFFIWNGEKFNDMLLEDSSIELNEALGLITEYKSEKYNGDKNDHFFEVIIEDYNDEIQELILREKGVEYKKQLCTILPLKYNPNFTYQNEIKKNYKQVMKDDFDRTAYNIFLNSEPLYKPYLDVNILEAGIYYWILKFPKTPDGLVEPFGLLWFTFNRKIVANPLDQPYGILVRSKNMLLGNNNSLVDVISRNKPDDYISSYRELTQTLQGVYGEMLIYSPKLHDNARRDWFKLDENSVMLRDIIFEYLKQLFNYRKAASKVFSDKANENRAKNKVILRDAFVNLTDEPDPKIFVDSVFKAKLKLDKEKEEKNEENKLEYADEDVPYLPFQSKKLYSNIMILLREYFSKEKNLKEFLKLRNYLKKGLNKE